MKSHGYPKIYAVGSAEVQNVFDGPVEITEKVDGSCLGFGKIDGELIIRSKNKELNLNKPESMFVGAVLHIKAIADRLPDDIFFYGECVSKPRHNVLTYGRAPKGLVCLFAAVQTVDDGIVFLHHNRITEWAKTLDMEVVQVLWDKEVPESFRNDSNSFFKSLLEKESSLGGRMEGIVVKNYNQPQNLHGRSCPITVAKLVSDDFKEIKVSKINRAGKMTKLDELLALYKTEARWHKAIQHLAENGELNYNATDIGPLIREVHKDLMEECANSFKEALFGLLYKQWLGAASEGFANYYKQYLIQRSLEAEEKDVA